ncbi:MAG: hypothetical protein EP332_02600 [Bacteroidetes bacterium]|nr:MAG: hypothetical protein EP332_02600 [Bacteroidota bacterium]
MKKGAKVYKSQGSKFGTCPKCGHRNGLNPFRFGGIAKATYELSGHHVTHHKCKKCLWQGYVMVNAEKIWVNRLTHAAFYVFWIGLLIIPLTLLAALW